MKQFHNYAAGNNITKSEFEQYAKDRDIELIDELDGLKVGDKVKFTNDFNIEFPGHTILGIRKVDDYLELTPGHVFYLDKDCYWYPARLNQLTPE